MIAVPWAVILCFLRRSTNPRIFPRPLEPAVALDLMEEWLSRPPVRTLAPEPGHYRLLRDLLDQAGTAGNLTTDTHLAALAIEHGAALASTDSDFARFPHLRWSNPLQR